MERIEECGVFCTKDCLKAIMEETWKFITPKEDRIISTDSFLEGVKNVV